MYKVIVSDLDGTLLTPAHIVSEQTKITIHKLLKQGKKFIIATGRHNVDVEAIRKTIDAEIYLITSNGARVHNDKGELIYSKNVPTDIAQIIAEIDLPDIYRDDEWFVNKPNPEILNFSQDSTFSYQVVDLSKLEKTGIAKFFFCGPHEDLVTLAAQINEQYSTKLNVSFSLPECLEVMDIKVNKAEALTEVLKIKGFTMAETIAFGDGMNDLEMLQAVDKGLIMGNASTMLKAALPNFELIGHSAEDGVAHYIEKNIL
ncbi:Cof-type HAD-IIB family hydrolase [Moritella viscosa]